MSKQKDFVIVNCWYQKDIHYIHQSLMQKFFTICTTNKTKKNGLNYKISAAQHNIENLQSF